MKHEKILILAAVFLVSVGFAGGESIFSNALIYTDANLSIGYITSNFIPFTTNAQDIGSNANQFKDAYVDGALYCDALGENLDADSNDISNVGTLAATTLTQDGDAVWDHAGGITYPNMSFSDNIVAGDIATDAVEAAEIKADAVGASEIATDAFETAEIKDGEVQTGDIAGANVTDAKIDFANSVDMDDLSDGATNAAPTLTQETNWDNHLADNTQAHTDYLLNSGADESSGVITAAGFTDGTFSVASGAFTAVASITDGTASWTGNNLAGFGTIDATTDVTAPIVDTPLIQDAAAICFQSGGDADDYICYSTGLKASNQVGVQVFGGNRIDWVSDTDQSDGMIEYYYNGSESEMGRIYYAAGGVSLRGAAGVEIETQGGDITLDPAGNDILPGSDNTDSLGNTTLAWKDIVYEGTLTDTSPTFSREEIKALTGKNPKQLLKEIKHNPDGHMNKSTIPEFLRPCNRFKPERENYKYEIVTCENWFNGTELVENCIVENKYTTTQKEDVELCEDFGEGLKMGEYTNLAFLALQEVDEKQEELEDRIKVLEAQLGI